MRRSNLQPIARRVSGSVGRPARQRAKALGVGSVGAVAIGRLSIGKLHLRRARIDRLEVGTLVIDRQEPEAVSEGLDSGDGGPEAQT